MVCQFAPAVRLCFVVAGALCVSGSELWFLIGGSCYPSVFMLGRVVVSGWSAFVSGLGLQLSVCFFLLGRCFFLLGGRCCGF